MNVSFNEFFKRIDVKRAVKYWVYMFVCLLCQNMLFTRLRILGVCPMVLPAAAVAVGMFEGAVWGGIFSLILGVFADMAFVENTVLFTVVFPALAFVSGFISHFFINKRFFAYMGAAAVGLLATAIAQMMGIFAIDGWSSAMPLTVALQTIWSLPFAALAYFPPAKWIKRPL